MFRGNVQAVFMQPIVISILSFHWMQLVVQTIVCDAGVFLSRWKLPCLYSYPCGHPCTMLHIGILWLAGIEGRGKKKTGEVRGKEFSHPSCPLWLSPTLRRFSQYGGYTSRKIRALKENAWECKFWFVLVLSVQPQLPSTGESSYSINMSRGNASIGDHSVTSVGTATPRWRIPKCYLLCNDH